MVRQMHLCCHNLFPDGRITAALASGDMTIFLPLKDVCEEAFAKIGDLPGLVPTTLKKSEMGYGDGVTVVSEDDIFRGPALLVARL